MKKTIDVQCGIYNTEYTLTRYRDGTGTVRAPYIKWTGNTGCLDFKNHKISKSEMPHVVAFFDAQELCDEYGRLLDDYLI